MLNKILLQIESEGTLVLQNSEIIKMGNKKYSRKASFSIKSYSLIDDTFKSIIFVY